MVFSRPSGLIHAPVRQNIIQEVFDAQVICPRLRCEGIQGDAGGTSPAAYPTQFEAFH
jgi:hypothetical protein